MNVATHDCIEDGGPWSHLTLRVSSQSLWHFFLWFVCGYDISEERVSLVVEPTPAPISFLFHFALQLSALKKIPTRRAQETGKIVVLLVSCLEKNRVLTISVALGVKVGFVAGDTAPIQGPLAQLLRAGLCFDRRAECNADSCFNFQPDADITHTEPET